MKKTILLASFISTIAFSAANAADYPNYAPNQYYGTYNNAAAKKNTQSYSTWSLGLDYVYGTTSFAENKTAEIENPLTGGAPYTATMEDFEDKLNSISVSLGLRPFKYFGIEAFFQQSLPSNGVSYQEHYMGRDRFAQGEYEIEYRAYGLDAIVFLPVSEKVELLGSLGYGNYDFTAEATLKAYDVSTSSFVKGNKADFSESMGAFRAGLGAQIRLSQRLDFRAMYRYVDLGGEFVEDISEISAGIRYKF